MAIRSAIRSWIKKAFRGLDWKHSAEVEREASAPPISIHNHFPKTGDAGRPTRFLLEKYQVNEEAKIEYVDKSGSRTTRTIQTEEVYEYSDGGLVIRAYCHKRKDYRAFIGDRIQSWKDTVTGAIVTNLGEHLRAQSGSDPGNIAEDIYTSHIVEINVAVGGLVKYSRTKGDFDYAVTGAKKMALIDYIVEKPEVVATLSTLPASDREDARDSLATMIADTTVSELTFEAAKKAFRKSRHEKKLDFISFIKETLKGDPSQSSTIGILTDDLIKTAPKKGENLIHPKEKITRKAVNKIKREEAAAKKAYKKKRKKGRSLSILSLIRTKECCTRTGTRAGNLFLEGKRESQRDSLQPDRFRKRSGRCRIHGNDAKRVGRRERHIPCTVQTWNLTRATGIWPKEEKWWLVCKRKRGVGN